ncbi:hypothetical protein DV714_05935 [Parageobacillus thermoglucosidasius]|nr:hypothetical protein DV714_05935 [Parageobacillus thermoglucosidasius]
MRWLAIESWKGQQQKPLLLLVPKFAERSGKCYTAMKMCSKFIHSLHIPFAATKTLGSDASIRPIPHSFTATNDGRNFVFPQESL